jgi:hypothetical protein
VSSQTACHPTRAQPSVPHNAPAYQVPHTVHPPRCHHHKHVRSTTSSFLTHPTSLALIASPVWRLLHTHSGAKMFAAITRAKLFAPIMHYHVVEGERTRPGVSNNGLTHAPAECGRAWTWPAFCVASHMNVAVCNIEARRRPVAFVWPCVHATFSPVSYFRVVARARTCPLCTRVRIVGLHRRAKMCFSALSVPCRAVLCCSDVCC